MTVDGRSAEALGAASCVVLAVGDEAVGLAPSNTSRRWAFSESVIVSVGGSSSRRRSGMHAVYRCPSSQIVPGSGPGRTPRWVLCRSMVIRMSRSRRSRASLSPLAVV